MELPKLFDLVAMALNRNVHVCQLYFAARETFWRGHRRYEEGQTARAVVTWLREQGHTAIDEGNWSRHKRHFDKIARAQAMAATLPGAQRKEIEEGAQIGGALLLEEAQQQLATVLQEINAEDLDPQDRKWLETVLKAVKTTSSISAQETDRRLAEQKMELQERELDQKDESAYRRFLKQLRERLPEEQWQGVVAALGEEHETG